MSSSLREELHSLIDSLPEESLLEIYISLWQYKEEEEKELNEEAKKEVQESRYERKIRADKGV
ncbi:hypothetical protein [Alteribacillus sp. YIM 98480]|uniref:hypothetical protein n=1 Tax=Alteribacillus sp. YIM 98480 TaxID=2606599 RepID=UPI00131B5595|nr:hypothetical protein [Alteribacillus sp. YIM 98480]